MPFGVVAGGKLSEALYSHFTSIGIGVAPCGLPGLSEKTIDSCGCDRPGGEDPQEP